LSLLEEVTMDIRTCPRHPIDVPIVCSPFLSRSRGCSGGLMRNYGLKGLYFESSTAFGVGTVLLVRMAGGSNAPFPACLEEGFRTIALAEVKWTRPATVEGREGYGLGLKYMSMGG
jgi:hypothetical protein